MAKDDFKLEQTESKFKFRGIVRGMDATYCYREGTIDKGRFEGKDYRSIRFGVETRPENVLYTELFGMEQDLVYPYKRAKKKGGKGTTLKHPFAQRNSIPKGYTLIGKNMFVEQDEKSKKYTRKSLVDFDVPEYLYDNLEDGQSVEVIGNIAFSEYNGAFQTQFRIDSVKIIDDIDFEAEGFKEVNSFEMEIVFNEIESIDEETKKIYVNAFQIGYADKFSEGQLVIDPKAKIKDIKKTANAFTKVFKFGDAFKVYGIAVNRIEIEEIENEEEDDSEVADIFGGEKPEDLDDKDVITTHITELLITSGDNTSYQEGKGKYTEDDFIDEETDDEDDDNNSNDDDYDDDDDNEGSSDPFDDDDLPF